MSDVKTQTGGMTKVPTPSQQIANAEAYTVTVESPEAGGILAYLVGPGATVDFGDIDLSQAAMREENGNLRITLADGSEVLLLDYVGASQSTQAPVLMSDSGTLTASQVMAQVLAADAFISATPAGGAEICAPGEEMAAIEPTPVAKEPTPQPAAPQVTVADLEQNFDIEPAAGPEAGPAVISGNGFVPAASAAALAANSGIISDVIDPFATSSFRDSIGEELQIFGPTRPDAVNDFVRVHCSDSVSIDVLANDTDPNSDVLRVNRVVAQPENGLVTLNSDGTITYEPNTGYLGTDTFTYEAIDPNGNADVATVTVEVYNNAPDAANDTVTTNEDTAVIINVLTNDGDIDGDAISVTGIATNPNNGSVVINANGTITYTPNSNFNGTDTFTYTITDDCGASDTATVNITVIPVNDAPDAQNDAITIHCGSTTTVNVLANDSDIEGDTLTVARIINQPSDVNAHINNDGTITVTPNGHFVGNRVITYEISDGNGGTDTATLTITFTNEAPDAANDNVSTNEDTPITINVLGNDSDPDGDTISTTRVVTNPNNGSVVINANGTITYTPNTNFNGTDTFTYQIRDDCGATDTATVTVTVNEVNDAPDARNDSATTHCGETLTVNVLGNDTDPDGDTLTVTRIVSQPSDVNATINANGTITVDPIGHFVGSREITYEISDGNGGTDTAVLTVNFTNEAPDAAADNASTNENTPVTINVLANDSDDNGDGLSVTRITANPSNGSVIINANGTITYTPNNGFFGTDTFTYQISDDCGATDTATVRITVNEVNDAPDARNDSATTLCGDAVVINVLGNDTDPNRDSLNVSRIVNQGANGTATINANGTITYTPTGMFVGRDTFTYQVSDGRGGTDTATVTVNVTNQAPDAVNDSRTTNENTPITINVRSNDSDPDGQPITVDAITANPSNGSVVINANGTITYTPNNGFFGTDTFTYQISDDCGATDTATVRITVNEVNDAPDAANDAASTHCGQAVTVNVLGNDTDPNGDSLTVTRIVNQPSDVRATVNANGTITVDPVGHFVGTREITYEISDGNGGTDTAVLTVNFTNEAPDANDDVFQVNENSVLYLSGGFLMLKNDTDPDGDNISIKSINGTDIIVGSEIQSINVPNGRVMINEDESGSIRFYPNDDYVGTTTFDYTVADDCGATDTATVTITVNQVNEAPDARNDAASTKCGDAVTVNVLGNDTDPDGDSLTVTRIVNQPSDVNATINANGTISVDPIGHFVGSREITYEISDGNGGTDRAVLTVNFTNEAPDANDDTAAVRRGNSVTFNVLSNDNDPDGNNADLEVTNFTQPTNGTLTYLGDGQFRYTGTRSGTFSFQYTIQDDCGATDTATATIRVTNPPSGGGGGGGGDDCPLVIDLDGDGIEIISRDNSNAMFDLDGDGVAESTAWVGSREAILAVDRNGDGMINGIDEVFGNSEMDGYQELAALEDTNGDGVIDANDAGWENLQLWIDANGNGVSDEGELVSLDEYGITSIDTNSTDTSIQYEDAYIVETGSVTLEDGSELTSGSVWYTNDSDNVILGTDGDDTLVMDDTSDVALGGAGEDVLQIVTEGDIELSSNQVDSIEVLDLTNDVANTVTLSASDVLNFNQEGTLTIMGDAEDEVNITNAELTQTGTTEIDGHTYATFNTDNGAELMIELGMTLNGETVQ